jgi:hypothetical protein
LNLFALTLFLLQINEWTTTGTFVTPQVRSLRKGNSDYVAIAVDEDPGSTSRMEDEDEDKGNLSLLNPCVGFWCTQKLWFINFRFLNVFLQFMVSNHSHHPKLSQDLPDP